MGFHSLWVTEMLFNRAWTGSNGLDSFGVLTAAASVTSRIRLLTAVLWPLHQPILSFADEMANIDNLSGGRLSLGLSNGSWPGEGDRDGSRTKAGGRLQETITVLKSLWLEPEVSFKGSHFNLEGASLDTRPIQNGGIPILVAGVTSASVNLAATLADGWVHPSGGAPECIERGCQIVKQVAERAGRDPDSLDLVKVIYLSIHDNRAKARERIAPFLEGFYRGRYDVDSWCAFGPPADCAAFIKRFLDAGFTTVMLCLVPPDAEHLERSHREVMPLLI